MTARGRSLRRRTAHALRVSLVSLALGGCGAPSPGPVGAPEKSAVDETAATRDPRLLEARDSVQGAAKAPKPGAPEPSPEDELLAAEKKKQASAPKPRQVVYRVTDEGLVIEVSGVRFRPTAKPVKNSKGGYEIELSVSAEGIGDDPHTLLSPKNGPLAMVATIYKKDGSEQARYVDERSGGDQEFVMPGGTTMLSRKWPSGSVHGPLWWGQKVKLEVGLWGLATGGEPGRPLNKLFVVEMVGGANPVAVISPPDV